MDSSNKNLRSLRARTISIVALGALCSCSDAEKRPDVLIVTLDTTRADHLGAYGYGPPTSPRIDALVASGVRFDRAWTHVPLTLPAHATLLTGLLPPELGIHDNGGVGLGSGVPVLTEEFRAHGYATGAFVSASVLNASFGLARGFERYDDEIGARRPPTRRAEDTVGAALTWLATQGDRPAFVWVHLYDPHASYDAPEPYRSRFESPYDAEIAYMDEHVGKLVDAFRARRGDALVVATADHGEGLGEHGESGHGTLIHAATMRVPLAFAWTGRIAPSTSAEPVQHVDVAPTILGLLGWKGAIDASGRDLAPLLLGGSVEASPIYGESEYAARNFGWSSLYSIGTSELRLVQGTHGKLHDPRTDLAELHDLAPSRPDDAAALAASLERMRSGFVPREAGVAPDDPRLLERLQALGYASSGRALAPDAVARAIDPADRIALVDAYTEALTATQSGRAAEAIPLLERVIAQDPKPVAFHFQLGLALQVAGRREDAERAYRAAIERDPTFDLAHLHLGSLLELAGRRDEALAAYRGAVEAAPRAWSHRERVARILVALGRKDEAITELRGLVERAPERSVYRIELYRLLRESGRPTDAARAVIAGLDHSSDDPSFALFAAWILATDRDDSVRDGKRAVALAEAAVARLGRNDADRLDTLAAARAEAGDFAGAVRDVDEALKIAQPDLAAELRARHALYESRQAFRD